MYARGVVSIEWSNSMTAVVNRSFYVNSVI